MNFEQTKKAIWFAKQKRNLVSVVGGLAAQIVNGHA